MQVFMKPPTGKTITLDVGALALTDTLKAKVLTKCGVLFDQQRRAFGGRQLEDGRALAECNIQNGSAIDLASRLRGGALGDDRNVNQHLTSGAAGNGNGGNEHASGQPMRRCWTRVEHLDRAIDLWTGRVLFRERRKMVMRRWRDGRHDDGWSKDIEAQMFWNWVRVDRLVKRHGYGVRARAERARCFEQLVRRETAKKEREGGKEFEMEMERRNKKRLRGE